MYSRCVHKAAIHCTADVFRRLQSTVYSRCVQKSAVRYVQQMCTEDCHTILDSHLDASFAHSWKFIVANFVHRGAPHSFTVTLVW